MKKHSFVDVITNSSATTFVYPYEDAGETIKEFLTFITEKIKEKHGVDVDLLSELEVSIVPRGDWVEDEISELEYEIEKYNEFVKDHPDLTDEELEEMYDKPLMGEELEEYLKNPDNAYNEEYGFPITELFVKLFGVDIVNYFDLYGYQTIS